MIYQNRERDFSSWYFVAFTALTGGCFWYYYSLQQRAKKEKPWPIIPGALPLLGHAHLIGSMSKLVDKLEAWADEYGKEVGCYEVSLGGFSSIVVCREDRAIEILLQRPSRVTRSVNIRESAHSIQAPGLFAAEGGEWKEERKIVAAALNRKNTEEYIPTMKVMLSRLVDKWRSILLVEASEKKENKIVINEDLSNLASDIISMVGMGKDFDFLNHPESQTAHDIKITMEGFVKRFLSPFWYWRIPLIGQYLDGRGWSIFRVDQLVRSVVNEFDRAEAQDEGKMSKKLFIQKVFDAMKSEKTLLTRKRMAGNVTTLYLAGTDTTSATTNVALYLLAKNIQLQNDLRTEADNFNWDAAGSIDEIFSQVPRIKSYLHEVHRFYAVTIVALEVAQDIPFCGTSLSRGTKILLLTRYPSISSTSPSKDVPLGPNGEPPSVFCPQRWLAVRKNKDDVEELTCIPPPTSRTSAGFLAFGHGVRVCPGRLYAEVLSLMTLVTLLQNFDWQLAENHPPVDIILHVTMATSVPIQLAMKQRVRWPVPSTEDATMPKTRRLEDLGGMTLDESFLLV